MESKYNPTDIEARWYQYWLDNRLFHSEPDGREPYTIVIPPPNVTGVLHMGHVLNETIQDILVRRARLEGKNADGEKSALEVYSYLSPLAKFETSYLAKPHFAF